MDVYESRRAFKHTSSLDFPKPSLERNNVARPSQREVRSRYKSPTPPSPSGLRRFSSPDVTRTVPASSQLVSKRALSAERKRPLPQPPSPRGPSTPVRDSSVNTQLLASRKLAGGRLPESLWPSTMRSLSVSFQSDTISIPVSKKEKPAPLVVSDRTLRPSSNVAHKQPESPSSRKPTPERKRSPLKGKNAPDQLENSKPVDGSRTRLIDQHRWPSRVGGKVSSNSLNRSADLIERGMRRSTVAVTGLIPPIDSTARLMSLNEIGRAGSDTNSVDSKVRALRVTIPHKVLPIISTERVTLTTPVARSRTSPPPASRPLSPFGRPSPTSSRPSSPFGRPSSVCRGVTPTRSRQQSTPTKVSSPSRIRPSSPSAQSASSTSVLSFIADVKKGQKTASYIEDAHQLRLLHNRYLQWHFANARAESVLYIQKVTAEGTLYDVWNTTLGLWDSVLRKRINVKQLKLELKLNTVLNNQVAYLDDWASLETDHINSLSGCVEDLEASTIRLPVTGGAKADIDSLKVAICSAVDVMQAMGPSICSLLSRVEAMNNLVSDLAVLAMQEKTMINQCEALLASTAALQVEEQSVRIHLIEIEQILERGDQLILPTRTFPWP